MQSSKIYVGDLVARKKEAKRKVAVFVADIKSVLTSTDKQIEQLYADVQRKIDELKANADREINEIRNDCQSKIDKLRSDFIAKNGNTRA